MLRLQCLSNTIIHLICNAILYLYVCHKDFWLLSLFWDAVMGSWGFSAESSIRQRLPVSVSSAEMLSSGLWIYEENVLCLSMCNFPLSKEEYGVQEQECLASWPHRDAQSGKE